MSTHNSPGKSQKTLAKYKGNVAESAAKIGTAIPYFIKKEQAVIQDPLGNHTDPFVGDQPSSGNLIKKRRSLAKLAVKREVLQSKPRVVKKISKKYDSGHNSAIMNGEKVEHLQFEMEDGDARSGKRNPKFFLPSVVVVKTLDRKQASVTVSTHKGESQKIQFQKGTLTRPLSKYSGGSYKDLLVEDVNFEDVATTEEDEDADDDLNILQG